MARVPDIAFEQMDEGQQRVYKEITASRRGEKVAGPFMMWIRNPDLADRINQLSNTLRLGGRLERRLMELMILVIARHWSAHYEWFVHEPIALRSGLSPVLVEAIRKRRTPESAREDERLVYDVITELNETKTLSQTRYDRAVAALGVDTLIELVTAAGLYSMVAMVINAFDLDVPDGTRPLA